MRISAATRPVLGAALLLLVACSGAGDGDDGAPAGQATAEEGDEQRDGDDTGDDLEDETTGPSGRLDLVGWEETHPGGTSVALRSIEVDDAGDLYIELEAISTQREIHLAWVSTFVRDDLDNDLDLVPPQDNPDLTVGRDERLRATLSFEGPLDPEARRVTLAINGAGGTISDHEDEASPRYPGPAMAFRDVPLPGVGLDEEAVGDGPDREALTDAAVAEPDASATHDSGLEITVERIEHDGRNMLIDVEILNPTNEEMQLARLEPQLEDDTGWRAHFRGIQSDDPAERTLEIPPGGEASVTLAFRATMREGTTMSLRFNRWSIANRHPHVLIEDLPIPGRD